MDDLVKEKAPFERMAVSREFALQMFAYNGFKRSVTALPYSSSGRWTDPGTGKSSKPFLLAKS